MSTQASFTCPDCGAVSYNPNDIVNEYCGRCHAFTGQNSGLAVFVIYHNPLDYPGKFVVRRQVTTPRAINVDRQPLGVVDSLDQARALLPAGLAHFDRHPDDEPQIVETWL